MIPVFPFIDKVLHKASYAVHGGSMSESDMNDRPSRKEFSFGGSSFFGYNKIVKQGDRVTLEGEDVPRLYQGMMVELRGDSRGYVPGGFRPGRRCRSKHSDSHLTKDLWTTSSRSQRG